MYLVKVHFSDYISSCSRFLSLLHWSETVIYWYLTFDNSCMKPRCLKMRPNDSSCSKHALQVTFLLLFYLQVWILYIY